MVVHKKISNYIFFISLFLILLTVLFLVPQKTQAEVSSATSVAVETSSRFNSGNYPSVNASAVAGNVTELSIEGVSPTQSWQGYYGNVTGTLTLEDSAGNTFYNWSLLNPSGEVYASPNSSVTWTNIKCFNFSGNSSNEINQTTVHNWFNIDSTDSDRFNLTFNLTTHSLLYVGSVTIDANTCPSTYVYDDSGYQTTNFENILLTDNESLVFATTLVNDQTGFDSNTHDFQMLVAEDGHNADTGTTPYYFWVELE